MRGESCVASIHSANLLSPKGTVHKHFVALISQLIKSVQTAHDHGRPTTQHHLPLLSVSLGQVGRQEARSDLPFRSVPLAIRILQGADDVKPLVRLVAVQFFFEEERLSILGLVQQSYVCLVILIAVYSTNDLDGRGDACTAADKDQVGQFVRPVLNPTTRTAELNSMP